MIPYYSPNFGFKDLFVTLLCRNEKAKLTEYFRKITGKEYILFTSSCRSALYLAYKSLGRSGIVHTSPLTCQVALHPIIAAGNEIMFHDIKGDGWTLNPELIVGSITEISVAIQAIHFGGFQCDMPSLRRICDDTGLALIEDCAQGFSSHYDGVNAGVLGDISCFTLTKNLYGLGGGVFATNNKAYYDEALNLQNQFCNEDFVRITHRTIMTILSSKRNRTIFEWFYQKLKSISKASVETGVIDSCEFIKRDLVRVPSIYLKSVAGRLDKINNLIDKRKERARKLVEELESIGFLFQVNEAIRPSYTKLFCYHPDIESESFISRLNSLGVELMHLEHKHKVYYQKNQLKLSVLDKSMDSFPIYKNIHDKLISVSLLENSETRKAIDLIKKVVEE
ncbi:MAG: DegT/DnrJ/EryC1/StrS family aminotransferase [Sphaerochaetaceae bacterium]